jgi:hypothetical protein
LAHEYRAAEKLFQVTRKIVNNQPLKAGEARSWRERYCVDMRTRSLLGPEDYIGIAPEYRLWIGPRDLDEAIGAAQPRLLPPARRSLMAVLEC